MSKVTLSRRAMIQASAFTFLGAKLGRTTAVFAESGNQSDLRSLPRLLQGSLVGIEIGPTGANDKDTIYFSKMNGKEIIESIRLANAEYLVVFLKDMEFAYYNSKVARKCPNLGDRDLLQECLQEAMPFDIPVVAYCQIQYDSSSWRIHPEWRMKGAKNEDLEPRLCYNSGYIDFIKTLAAEMMDYQIAGFHFDMLDYGFLPPLGCWCETCCNLFKERYSIEMPTSAGWDEAWDHWLAFRADSNTRFCSELQSFVHSKRPDISVDFNYHGYPPFTWLPGELPVKHANNGDFVTAEGLPFVFGHSNPSLLSLFMKGARSDGRVQGVTSRSVYDYHDFSIRPTAEIKWEVMTYLAHGAQCTVVDKSNYDGSLDRIVYERLGLVFSEARSKSDSFGHEPLTEVGLYYSSRSRDFFAREDTPRYCAAFQGAHRALVQSHIQMGILFDEKITLDQLQLFKVIYLPNAAILSNAEVNLLSEYVNYGGNLLITGLTGTCDFYGNILGSSLLEKLIGGRLNVIQKDHPDNYIRFLPADDSDRADSLTSGIPKGWPLLVWGPVASYQSVEARSFGELLIAYRSKENLWSHHMSPDETIGPAVLINQYGKGTVVTIPAVIDAAFIQRYRMPEHRHLICNAIRFLNPDPDIRIDAPSSVEAVVTRDHSQNRVFIHLLSFTAPPTASAAAFPDGRQVLPPVMEESVLYRAQIKVTFPVSKVRVSGKDTEVSVNEGVIHLFSSEIHEVVEII